MTDDTRARLMRLLEPNRMGRAPAVRSPAAGPAAEGPVAPSAEAAAPEPAPTDPLARRRAALRTGGEAWSTTPAAPAIAAPVIAAPSPPAPPPVPAPAATPAPAPAATAPAAPSPPAPPPVPAPAATPAPAPAGPDAPAPSAVTRLLALKHAVRGSRSTAPAAGPAEPDATPAHTTGARDFALLFPCEPRSTAFGPAWVLTDRLDPETPHGDRALGAAWAERLVSGPALAILTGERAMADFDLAGALFLDLESTGLALAGGTLPFLVGTAHFQGGALVLEQWLLREPDDEAAALTDLATRIADADWLVTFNGRTFDLPLLRTRWRLHRLPDPSAGLRGHLDLLPASRRVLKHGLPNCRLGTLERHLLGLHRVDDVTGSEVPACYHAWLHDRNPAPLAGVVKHNRLDVLSMVTLLDELQGRVLRPESTLLRDPPCALKLAERARRFDAPDLARRIYEAGLLVPETQAAAALGLARMARAARRRPRGDAK